MKNCPFHCIKLALSCIGLVGVLSSAIAANQTPVSDKPQDYAHALPLTVSGKQGVVGLRLPQAVYLNAHSPNLNDLRVFDATGAGVPFALYVPPTQTREQRVLTPVKIFPITSTVDNQASHDAIDLDIKTAADGTLVSVKTKSAPRSGEATHLAGLVLDLRQAVPADDGNRMIDALHFSLPASMTSYSAQVWLEVSDDLTHWDTVGAAELSWLVNSDTQSLANDRLELSPRSFRYARLTWRSGQPIQFQTIAAESLSHIADAPKLDQLLIAAKAGKEPGDLVYPAALAIPVERLSVQFTEPNIVLPAAIGQYRELPSRQIGQPSTWQFNADTQATLYQITQDGKQRRSGDIALPLTHAAEWVVRSAITTTAKPSLTVMWQPATLVFLTSGKPPYSLAFGRDKISSAALDLSQVAPGFSINEIDKLELASAGALQTQTGSPAAESEAAAASTAAHQRMWILWGVLLVGVAVLGGMAWRLLKTMK